MSRQKGKPAWEQPRWVAFAILALLVLVSTAASAQTTVTKTNETHDQTWTVKNPCNPNPAEEIVINGRHHVMASQQTQKNGRVHLQMTDSRQGQGLGTPSGKHYTYSDTSRTNVIVPAPPDGQPTGIHRVRMKVVSEGSTPDGDNFFMTVVTMIHRNGSSSGSQERVECRGQGKETF